MTAYYSLKDGQTIKSGTGTGNNTMMRNFPISVGSFYGSNNTKKMPTVDKRQIEQEMEKIEEIEDVENQISWFERTRVDEGKRPRYANINLQETFNYSEKFV